MVREHDGRRPVTVTASIGVTALWLLPRLGRFQQLQPQIDVRVAANNKVMDLAAEDVDLAIRYCSRRAAPDDGEHLFGEAITPVAAPVLGLAESSLAEAVPSNVLLEYDDPKRPWLQWSEWLHAKGLGAVRPRGMLRFNQYDQIVHACMAGQGLALGRVALIAPMLANGRLVALRGADPQAVNDYGYWLLQASASPRADVAAVAQWIRSESNSLGHEAT
jgi:DNA-binding transcriptional LysR family regulator